MFTYLTTVNGVDSCIFKSIFYKKSDSSKTPVDVSWSRPFTNNANVGGSTSGGGYYNGTTYPFTFNIDNQEQSVYLSTSSKDYSFIALQGIVNAYAGESITLTNDFAYDSSKDSTEGVVITKPITINGDATHTINGNKSSRIFNITGDNVILSNLKLPNSNSEAILSTGSNV